MVFFQRVDTQGQVSVLKTVQRPPHNQTGKPRGGGPQNACPERGTQEVTKFGNYEPRRRPGRAARRESNKIVFIS